MRHSTTRIFNGKRVKRGDVVEGTKEQKQALLGCSQAYEEKLEPKPTLDNTKQEIIDYLNANYIEHDSTVTKAELIELV